MKKDTGMYSGIYRELLQILGSEAQVRKIWSAYRGITVNFPKRLYAREYVLEYIREHMYTEKTSEIARKMDLSERRVRQIIREIREGEAAE